MRTTRLPIVTLLIMAGFGMSAHAEWLADAGLGATYTHNLNFSDSRSEAENDWQADATASLGYVMQATNSMRVGFTGYASGQLFERFDKLNGATLGGKLSVTQKMGLGNAPVVRAHYLVETLEVRDEMREGVRRELGLGISKRITDRLELGASASRSIRHGHNGSTVIAGQNTDVFDQKQFLASINGSYLLSERSLLSFDLGRMKGDFAAQCPAIGIGLLALNNTRIRAAATDTVYGGSCTYRLDGVVHLYGLGYSYFLDERTSIDAGYRFRDGRAGGFRYNSSQASVAVNMLF